MPPHALELERDADVATALLRVHEQLGQGWFWATDATGALVYASPEVIERLSGATEAANIVIGNPLAELLTTETSSAADGRTLQLCLARRTAFQQLIVQPIGGGEPCSWSISGKPFHDRNGNFIGFRGSGTDITAERRKSEQAARLALLDPLTELPNRNALGETLDRLLRLTRQTGRKLWVMIVDLDRFKQVNDTLGHPIGDALLKQVAQRLQRLEPASDRSFRFGGDEFVVLAEGDIESVSNRAADIITMLSQPYSIEGIRCAIGATIGISEAPANGTSPAELLRSADLALYAGKADGRGCLRFYDDRLLVDAEERRFLDHDLRDAIARGELEMAYQPFIDPLTHEFKGAEALVRWRHPQRGLISPATFIPIAEETDLILKIGEWVLRRACADAARWPENTRLAVNVSPIQIANDDLPGLVVSALAASQLSPHRLELEVTESVLLQDSSHTEATFATLKRTGVRLALDDFGTGYSSLGYLRTSPVSKIKIDQSFVRSATLPNSRDKDIVAAIVTLADALGMETTAEGVESLDLLALVRDLGVTYVQGYVYSKPVDAATIEQKLSAGEWKLEPSGPAKQRSRRISMLRSVGVVYRTQYLPALIRNMSETGALIEGQIDARIGDVVLVDFGNREIAFAHVRRADFERYGVEFDEPLVLDPDGNLRVRNRVSHHLLRKAGLPVVAIRGDQVSSFNIATPDDELRSALGFEASLPATPSARYKGSGGASGAGQDMVGNHAPTDAAPRDMRTLVATYIASIEGNSRRQAIDREYLERHFLPAFETMPPERLTPRHVSAWLTRSSEAGLPPRVIERLRVILGQLFALASGGSPGIRPTTFDRRDLADRLLTLEEIERLAAATRTSVNGLMSVFVCLLLLTAAKPRHLLAARWPSFDLERRIWRPHGSDAGRSVKLSEAAVEILRNWRDTSTGDWLFENQRTGRPYRSLATAWRTIRERAALPWVELEDLAHGVRMDDLGRSDERIVALFVGGKN